MNIRSKELKELQKKHNIEFDSKTNTYSKLFYITNIDAIDYSVRPMFYTGLVDYSSDTLDLTEGDTIEIRFEGLKKLEYPDFTVEAGLFEIKNARNELTYNCTLELDRFNEIYYRHFGEFDSVERGELDPEEKIFYKYAANSIGYRLKENYDAPAPDNIKIHYRMTFTEDECNKYLEGYKILKDEEKALEYIYNEDCVYSGSKEFKLSDILLLYSDFALKVIYNNIDRVKEILSDYDLEIKGAFYSKCDFEVDNQCYGDEVEAGMLGWRGDANGLYIVVGTDSEYYDTDDMLEAAEDINVEFGIRPQIYAGLSLISRETRENLIEGVDYKFIKGIDKAKLLFADLGGQPHRYKGNFLKAIDVYGDWLDSYEFELLRGFYTYRIDNNVCSVYIELIDDWTDERTLKSYTVNTSSFSKDELSYMTTAIYEMEEMDKAEFDELSDMEKYDRHEYSALLALYSVLFKMKRKHNPVFAKYVDVNSLDNKIANNISEKVVSLKVLEGEEADLFMNKPIYEQVAYTRDEIFRLESGVTTEGTYKPAVKNERKFLLDLLGEESEVEEETLFKLLDIIDKSLSSEEYGKNIPAKKQFELIVESLCSMSKEEVKKLEEEFVKVRKAITEVNKYENFLDYVHNGDDIFYHDFPAWLLCRGTKFLVEYFKFGARIGVEYILDNRIPQEEYEFESMYYVFLEYEDAKDRVKKNIAEFDESKINKGIEL